MYGIVYVDRNGELHKKDYAPRDLVSACKLAKRLNGTAFIKCVKLGRYKAIKIRKGE